MSNMRVVSDEELKKAGLDPEQFTRAIFFMGISDFESSFDWNDEDCNEEDISIFPEELEEDFSEFLYEKMEELDIKCLNEHLIDRIVTRYLDENKSKIRVAKNKEIIKYNLEKRMKENIK